MPPLSPPRKYTARQHYIPRIRASHAKGVSTRRVTIHDDLARRNKGPLARPASADGHEEAKIYNPSQPPAERGRRRCGGRNATDEKEAHPCGALGPDDDVDGNKQRAIPALADVGWRSLRTFFRRRRAFPYSLTIRFAPLPPLTTLCVLRPPQRLTTVVAATNQHRQARGWPPASGVPSEPALSTSTSHASRARSLEPTKMNRPFTLGPRSLSAPPSTACAGSKEGGSPLERRRDRGFSAGGPSLPPSTIRPIACQWLAEDFLSSFFEASGGRINAESLVAHHEKACESY